MKPTKVELPVRSPGFKHRDPWDLRRDCLPILAFDPGGTTGWSLISLPTQINGKDTLSYPQDVILAHALLWEHGEIPSEGNEEEVAYAMARLAGQWESAAIVVEDFILRSERKEKSRELLSPVRITAKFETYMWRHNRHVFKQDPSQAIGLITNDRLDLLGVKVDDGCPDHARDADRHVILFLRRCIGIKGAIFRRAAWPHIYGSLEDYEETASGL